MIKEKWEQYASDTYRLRVDGGWIYRVRAWEAGPIGLVFVPDPKYSDFQETFGPR